MKSNYKNLKANVSNSNKVLIIHHWDCDGLCSAALLHRYLGKINKDINIEFYLPKIGYYCLAEEDYKFIKGKKLDIIFIVDYALSKGDILELRKIAKDIYLFDHHRQEKINEVNHINPFTEDNLNSLDFPSAGWVINKYFGKQQEILSILGSIGDQEEKVKNNKVVKKIIERYNLTFFDCTKIVKNIDSNYITNNKDGVYWTISFLVDENKNIKSLLDYKKFIGNNIKIEKEINRILNNDIEIDNNRKVIIKKFSSNYNIISNIARELSKKFPEHLVIVINDNGKISNIYFRRKKMNINLMPIIDFSHQQGYNCGGKEEVVGVFVPEKKSYKFIKNSVNLIIT